MDEKNTSEHSGSSNPSASNPPEKPSPLRRREQAATDAIRTLIRDIQTASFGEYQGPETLRLPLEVTVRPGENWSLQFDPSLENQVFEQLQEAQADRIVPLPGHVYCYRCRSFTCSHSHPTDSLQVFAGYSPTGQPEWLELAQALIQWEDNRTDRLFSTPPEIIARMLYGRALKIRQLSSFGRSSLTYSILAQTVAGYFPHRPNSGTASPKSPTERLALTFQAVESRTPKGEVRLTLNVICGGLSEPQELENLLAEERGWAPAVYRAREIATRHLQDIERKTRLARQMNRRDEASRLMRQIPVVLARLAESLERGDRQQKRRTQHAEERRRGNRPIHTALQDALALGPENWHVDSRTAARVAVTPEGRVHLFSEAGRHITSFLLMAPELEHRLRTGRWQKMDPADAIRFKDLLQSPPSETNAPQSDE